MEYSLSGPVGTLCCTTENQGACEATQGALQAIAGDSLHHQKQAACQTLSEHAVSVDQAAQTQVTSRAASPRPTGKQTVIR